MTWPTGPAARSQAGGAAKEVLATLLREFVPTTERLTVFAGSSTESMHRELSERGVAPERVDLVALDTTHFWLRDFGPLFAVGAEGLFVVDGRFTRYGRPFGFGDDELPSLWAARRGLPMRRTTLVFDGGSIDVDGQGTALVSDQLFRRNSGWSEAQVRNELEQLLGVTRPLVVPTLEEDRNGHVDMVAKFLAPGRVLVGEYPPGTHRQAWADQLAFRLSAEHDARGAQLEVVRVPFPKGRWQNYANALVHNDRVFVPSYGVSEDSSARRVFERAYPGRRVVSIRSDAVIESGGAVHCLAMNDPF